MLLRKGLGFIITSLVSAMMITLIIKFQESYVGLEFFVVVFIIAAPIIFVYGVPVSMLADKVTQKFKRNVRSWSSLFIHLFFGMIFIFVYGLFLTKGTFITDFTSFWREGQFYFFCSIITAILFWGIDEFLRRTIKVESRKTIHTDPASQ